MIDANLNRTREGLRVIEDCARFVLDDGDISRACKDARHDLRTAIDGLITGAGLDSTDLIASRDTLNDVGTAINTAGESDRGQGMPDLVQAAAKRATEALRVIEESAKAIGGASSSGAFESIRYRLYTIEQRVILALQPLCPQWSLCVLITADLCTHFAPSELIKRIAQGGAQCIQIREKHMGDGELLEHSALLTRVAHDEGLDVMINDRAHIAGLVGADGVHLGQGDLPIAEARKLLGHGKWIGRTCRTHEHAIEAVEQGADTCGLGPVFASGTKPNPTLAGLGLVESYLNSPKTNRTPMLAISGIEPGNVDQLATLGCPGVAVSSCVCTSDDPAAVCRRLVDAVEAGRSSTLNEGEATMCP
tara:strand:- start:146805 stop:147893 length:1089 start_codon:yes stop_codon:yes gene_type:complete